MKRVLITGANSYVGTNVEKWLMREPDKYYVETLDMKDPNWKNFDFSKFDVVFHVAGIAHIKETKENRHLYYKVNRDLAFETALKSKISGVKHFIFLSSMSVFSSKEQLIDFSTIPNPESSYGKSKYEAELKISDLRDEKFHISIVRPPMIYGANCPGNYSKLRRFALKYNFFININNMRSFLYISNLCYFIKKMINDKSDGVYHPYNSSNVSTTNMVKSISKYNGKKIVIIPLLGTVIRFIPSSKFKKISRDLYYNFPNDIVSYIDFDQTVNQTEEGWI